VGDPVFSTNEVGPVHVCPLNSHTIVVAFNDNTEGDVSFIVYDTNGSNLTDIVDADTDAAGLDYTSVGVSAFNSTHFVVGWYDGTDGDASFAVYNSSGSLVSGPIDVDTDVGTSHSVQVSALNSTHFVIAWFDSTDLNVSFAVYSSSGSLVTGPVCVDDDAGTDSYAVSVSSLNSTHFVVGWYDRSDQDVSFAVYTAGGSLVTGPVDVDTDAGIGTHSVSVSTLNSTYFVIGWYGANSNWANFSVYTVAGSSVSSAGVDSGSPTIQVSALNSTHFVASWYDDVDHDLTYAIYNSSGGLCVGPTDLETWPTDSANPLK